MKEPYRSRVYADRPAYADFDAPAKFEAIKSIIAKRLREHPKAICSYSGGSDSDILIDLIERTREALPFLPPVKYIFFNTGLEMRATKKHVEETAKKYSVEIEEIRPKLNIVNATRKYGLPFISKAMSEMLSRWQSNNVPLSIAKEYFRAEDKQEKYNELIERYPNCKTTINFLCSCNALGTPQKPSPINISSSKYMLDFLRDCPPDFQISAKCCDYCKKQPAHQVQRGYDIVITGERFSEGGIRATAHGVNFEDGNNTMCFYTYGNQYRFRPIFYITDKDKAWYKERYGIRYSDAYEVYGLTRTGCCGCPISSKAVEELERIRPYEPNVVKAAYNIFGKSYEYRQKYNEYKERRKEAKEYYQYTFEDLEQEGKRK